MKWLAITAITVFSCGSVLAQTSGGINLDLPDIRVPGVYDIAGSGARARGMGNAFLAAGDDITALTWNPAGIYAIDKPMMTFGISRFVPRGTASLFVFENKQTGAFSGPGLFSFASPFRIKGHGFVGGISYSRSTDEADNVAAGTAFYIDPDGPASIFNPTLYTISIDEAFHADLTPVTFGFGTRVSEKVSVGASLTVMTGKSVNVSLQHDFADSFFFAEYGAQKVSYDFTGSIIDSSKFSGVSFLLGFKYSGTQFSIGAIAKLPYSLRQTTNRTASAVTTVNGLIRSNGTGTVFIDDNITKIQMPMIFGVGGALKPNAKTTFAVDVEYRPFSGKQIMIRDSVRLVPGAKDEEFYRTIDPKWRNVLVIRAGGEYLWTTNSQVFPVVPLRAGFGILPVPRPNLDIDGNPSGTPTGINLSVGTGVHWSQILMDIAYAYGKRTETYGDSNFKSRTHQFQMTFTGYF